MEQDTPTLAGTLRENRTYAAFHSEPDAIAREFQQTQLTTLVARLPDGLGTRSAALMREVITDVARDCTVLLIAHRLCTVAMADNIVVMEAGMVRAVGSHHALLDSDSLYQELVHNQLMPAADEPAGSLVS